MSIQKWAEAVVEAVRRAGEVLQELAVNLAAGLAVFAKAERERWGRWWLNRRVAAHPERWAIGEEVADDGEEDADALGELAVATRCD